jgi:O-antigen/teichoic acid export membrane protein
MGVAIAFQLSAGFYTGGLMGLQRQVEANLFRVAWSLFLGGGSVLVLWLFSPTIFAFALWQLISNAGYCFLVRASLWRCLSLHPIQKKPHFTSQVFRQTWRFAAGMTGMTIIGILLSQTDKLVVSKMLSLESFGYYTIAGTIASVPIMLAGTAASALFPRFTELVALNDQNGLERVYIKACELIGVAIIPAGLILVFFGGDAVYAWTGSTIIAERAGMVASILVLAQMGQAITVVPYNLALAHGNIWDSARIGITSICLVTPLLFFLINKYDIVGAGTSWLILQICSLPLNMYFLHRRVLPSGMWRHCMRGVRAPIVAALPFVILSRWIMPDTLSRLLLCCELGLLWVVATSVSVIVNPSVRISLADTLVALKEGRGQC